MCRDAAERIGATWGIVSAKYGLLLPDDRISPYNVRMDELTDAERRVVVLKVRDRIEQEWGKDIVIISFLSSMYRIVLPPEVEILDPLVNARHLFAMTHRCKLIRDHWTPVTDVKQARRQLKIISNLP